MKITISGPAAVYDIEDQEILDSAVLQLLQGTRSEDSCVEYLDDKLSDIGLVGGYLEFAYDEPSQRLRIVTVYHSPRELKTKELKKLVEETRGQWSDGIGEGGFEAETRLGIRLDPFPTMADVKLDDVRAEQIDDGVIVKKPRKSPLFNVIKKGDISKLRMLLSQGEDIGARDQLKRTPLLAAVAAKSPEAVALLIDARAELNISDKIGTTPVTYAAMFGLTEILQQLLTAGADPNYCSEHEAYAHYPLHLACNRGQFEAVKLLVEQGAHVNLQCRSGYSAIMHLKANHLEIAKFLVEHGANTELVNRFGKGMDAELKKALGGPM